MQAAILPLSAGWSWIVQGYDLFRRQPMAMLFWSVATSFVINAGSLIPILGQIVLVILTPLLTFLTLCACRNLDRNVRMLPGLWFAPLKQAGIVRPLIRLGLAYLAATFAAAAVATVLFWSQLVTALQAQADKPISHDHLFHSVLGLMDVQTSAHDLSLDILAPCVASYAHSEEPPRRPAS